jgi:glutaredoxin
MFWMNGCPHCHEVLDNVLPPLQEEYGERLDILLVEVATMQDIEMLYQVAAAYNIPEEQTFVPFLIIGETTLIGADNIQVHLPGSSNGISLREAWIFLEILHSLMSLSTAPPCDRASKGVYFLG